jgi:hypothetical protein
MRIEISFVRLDPPEGVAARVPPPGGGPLREPQAFVGWLGLFGLLQALTGDRGDEPPL